MGIDHGGSAQALGAHLAHQFTKAGLRGLTRGTAAPERITSRRWVSSLRPSDPPGCERAKSSALKPRNSSKATARASPRAIWAVVDAGGQVQRAGFLLDGTVEHHIGVPRGAESGATRHGQQRYAQALEHRQQGRELFTFTGI